ncbi:hypothetical protein ACKKBF_B33540 [Auxenochlorella protothecoides x Auxenochlorella symbiontica]
MHAPSPHLSATLPRASPALPRPCIAQLQRSPHSQRHEIHCRAVTGSRTCLKEWAPVVEALRDGTQTILLRKGGLREPVFRPADSSFLLFPTAFHTEDDLLRPHAKERYRAVRHVADGAEGHVPWTATQGGRALGGPVAAAVTDTFPGGCGLRLPPPSRQPPPLHQAQALAYDPRSARHLELATGAVLTGAWTTADPAVLQLLADFHIWAPRFLDARLRWRPRQPITVLELRAFRLANPARLATAGPDVFGCFSWLRDAPGAPQGWLPSSTPALDDVAFAARQLRCRRLLSALTADEICGDLVQPGRLGAL